MNENAEILRVRYKYRSLIVRGELRLPLEAARKLIGPDCAYHLYASLGELDAGRYDAGNSGRSCASDGRGIISRGADNDDTD